MQQSNSLQLAGVYSIVSCSRFTQKESSIIKGDNYASLVKSSYSDIGSGKQWLAAPDGSLFVLSAYNPALQQVNLNTGTVLGKVSYSGSFGMKMSTKKDVLVGTNCTSAFQLWVADYSSTLNKMTTYSSGVTNYGTYANAEEVQPGKWLFYCKASSGTYKFSLFDVTQRRFIPLTLPSAMSNKGYSLASDLNGSAYATNNADSVFKINVLDTAKIVISSMGVIPNLKSLRYVKPGQFLAVQKNAISLYSQDLQLTGQKTFDDDIDAVSFNNSICAITFKGTKTTYQRIEIWDLNSLTCKKVIPSVFNEIAPIVLTDGTVVLYATYVQNYSSYTSFFIVK